MKKSGLYFCILLIMCSSCARRRSVCSIPDPKADRAGKEAILILPGFGSKVFGNRKQEKYFSGKGYDLFIPNYINRGSIGASLANLERFYSEHKLGNYKKVHVFSYIVGSWVLNRFINAHPGNNIASIVYDRSPLQERAPLALTMDMPVLIYLAGGEIMWEFAGTPYTGIEKGKRKIGILIESKATPLVRKHKETVMSIGPVNWSLDSLKQECDDYEYTRLNHDEMYTRFDVIGQDILDFFKNGKFGEQSRRDPFDWDYFKAYSNEEDKTNKEKK